MLYPRSAGAHIYEKSVDYACFSAIGSSAWRSSAVSYSVESFMFLLGQLVILSSVWFFSG